MASSYHKFTTNAEGPVSGWKRFYAAKVLANPEPIYRLSVTSIAEGTKQDYNSGTQHQYVNYAMVPIGSRVKAIANPLRPNKPSKVIYLLGHSFLLWPSSAKHRSRNLHWLPTLNKPKWSWISPFCNYWRVAKKKKKTFFPFSNHQLTRKSDIRHNKKPFLFQSWKNENANNVTVINGTQLIVS